jgi:predicted nucleotidyltransferase
VKASAEQLATLRTVARALGTLNREVVYVGGITTGLLVSDPGAPMARPTRDVDLVIDVKTTADYQTKLRSKLLRRGFREDSSQGARLCRWMLGSISVDVMPVHAGVLGFSNEWYPHARATARATSLPADAEGEIAVQIVSAPAFVATKLVAWKDRGGGDLLHSDLEDVIAVVDGRAGLLSEIEAEPAALRTFLAQGVSELLATGLEDHVGSHLQGDSASQSRTPIVLTALRRIARGTKVLELGETVVAQSGGDPGATTVSPGSLWEWQIVGIERALASKPPAGSAHVAIVARLTSRSVGAGTIGDGRDVFVEDWLGRRFRPLYGRLQAERRRRAMPGPSDPIRLDEPFDTVWVYELPTGAKSLRLVLPFDNIELPFTLPGSEASH